MKKMLCSLLGLLLLTAALTACAPDGASSSTETAGEIVSSQTTAMPSDSESSSSAETTIESETPPVTESVTAAETAAESTTAAETAAESENRVETESTETETMPTTETEFETATETEHHTETETESVMEDLVLIQNGTCISSLVQPSKTTEMVGTAFDAIAQAVAKRFGTGMDVMTDQASGGFVHGEYISEASEILLGETNRMESRDVYLSLAQGQYAIRAMGNKLVIIGYTDALTALAAADFVEHYVKGADGMSLQVPGNLDLLVEPYAPTEDTSTYEIESIAPVGDALHASTEQWVACEMELISTKEYEDPVYTVDLDVVFHHKASGKTLVIPAFWDGGTSFKVRFTPTEVGEWSFYTVCTDPENDGLHHRAGTVTCSAYTGELDIYVHGFIKTEPGKNYFMYADGTPFFYLGDTYWTLPLMELDSYGSIDTQKNAGITREEADANGITSQFTYIMDYRAAQGYTVIQSQPLGWWTNPGQNGWFADTEQNIYTYGVNDIMLAKFQQYDRYFAYIAEKGLVHSHTQFGYPTALMNEYFGGRITDEQLEKLCRYWVARYGAYPVMWATTQEGDNDYYGERGDCAATPETNPWLKVFAYVQKYDAYHHPATCHQEHWSYTGVRNTAFGKLDGHTWYAAQYNNSSKDVLNWNLFREFWNNPGCKPVVNYEGRYDHFWTGTYGSRAQGWMAFMNGQFGYGYGVQPIWNIFWSGNGISNWTGNDEWGEFNLDDNWLEGLRADAGEQVTYIRDFLSEYEWWRLTPCFDQSYFYKPGRFKSAFCHIGNDLYIGYLYGENHPKEQFGSLYAMKSGDYRVTWFNCQTGVRSESFTVTVTDGTYKIPKRPADGDWAIAIEFVG